MMPRLPTRLVWPPEQVCPPGLIWMVAALGVVSLGAGAGPVVWRLSGDEVRIRVGGGAAAPAPVARPDITPILAFAPFGTAAIPDAPPADAGDSGLGLALIGITLANPASLSRAIIAGGDTPVRGYAVGEAVTAAAILTAIRADHAVLTVDGQPLILAFADAQTPGSFDLQSLPAAPAPATTLPPDAVIARYRAEIRRDAQGVLDGLGLQATGQGYLVSDQAPPVVAKAGFLPGDVVRSVNGRAVGDMTADADLFDEVAASGRARVEIMRDGQAIVLSFPLR